MPVSNRPSDHQSGGQQFGITAGKVEIVDACFYVDQYANDKATGASGALMTVALLTLQPLNDNWEPDPTTVATDNKYTCGGKYQQNSEGTWHLTFYPTADPNGAYDKDFPAPDVGTSAPFLEGARDPDKISRWSQFLAACVKNGFKEEKLEPDIRCLIGSKFTLGPVKFMSVGNKEEIIAAPVDRFHFYPYEAAKATTTAKKGAPAKKTAAAPAPAQAQTSTQAQATTQVAEQAPAPATSNGANGTVDINNLSMEYIEKAVNALRSRQKESVSLSLLARDVLGFAMQPSAGLERADQKAIGANAKDPGFLEILADTLNIKIEGDTVTLLPV